jgi:hypothetical protein
MDIHRIFIAEEKIHSLLLFSFRCRPLFYILFDTEQVWFDSCIALRNLAWHKSTRTADLVRNKQTGGVAQITNQAIWRRTITPDLYSEEKLFESRSGHELSWVIFLAVFLTKSSLQIGHYSHFLCIFQFTVHNPCTSFDPKYFLQLTVRLT